MVVTKLLAILDEFITFLGTSATIFSVIILLYSPTIFSDPCNYPTDEIPGATAANVINSVTSTIGAVQCKDYQRDKYESSKVLVTCSVEGVAEKGCPQLHLSIVTPEGNGIVQPTSFEGHQLVIEVPDEKTYGLEVISSRYRLVGTYQVHRNKPIEVRLAPIAPRN